MFFPDNSRSHGRTCVYGSYAPGLARNILYKVHCNSKTLCENTKQSDKKCMKSYFGRTSLRLLIRPLFVHQADNRDISCLFSAYNDVTAFLSGKLNGRSIKTVFTIVMSINCRQV